MPKVSSCDNLKPTGFGVKWPSDGNCQRQCHFHIRLDPNNGCATLVPLVYSFTPARRRQFGVAVAIAAENALGTP